MSPLLSRIESLLKSESDSHIRAEAVARRAIYLARIGKFEQSKKDVTELRQVFGDGRNGRVTVHLMLAEAIALHFEHLSPNALDRLLRAELLSQAMKDRQLMALTSAWRAYFAFEASDFEVAARCVQASFDSASENNHDALSRCAVVLFNAFALCGDSQHSQHWFMNGKNHAVDEGDQATIDALLHSRAAFGTAWLTAQRCKGAVSSTAVSRLRSEISSARNLQHLTGVDAHSRYIDLCDARLQIIEGRYQSAGSLIESLRGSGPFPSGHFSPELAELELAYIRFKQTSDLVESQNFLLLSQEQFDRLDVDDNLFASWLLWELSLATGHEVSTAKLRLIAALEAYDSWLTRIRKAFGSFATS